MLVSSAALGLENIQLAAAGEHFFGKRLAASGPTEERSAPLLPTSEPVVRPTLVAPERAFGRGEPPRTDMDSADRMPAARLRALVKKPVGRCKPESASRLQPRAGEGDRTLDIRLGKPVLYH